MSAVEMIPAPNIFADTGLGFDRCADKREDLAWLNAQAQTSTARFLQLDAAGRAAVSPDGQHLLWGEPSTAATESAERQSALFLGCADGSVYFATQVAPEPHTNSHRWMDLREAGSCLAAAQAHLFAYAKAMQQWAADTRFCARCGAPLLRQAAGHRFACSDRACGKLHFPRTDAAIIVIVDHQGRCLLGRQAHWEPGRYSSIAGFVEPGESLEDAVRREVAEETGVQVGSVRYHSSQPWPLPASLMIGFHAQAIDPSIQLHDHELEDARWFSPEQLIKAVQQQQLRLPAPVSISYRLLSDWFYRCSGQSLAQRLGTTEASH